jgi:oxepin-CoA hydrolase / 3-oxo-5,6-dehydrosuberyl-CoA semialdehyde dehydrogenase
LFVYPNKGPVAANYGLEECRFLRPIYHNDTVYVRLTCKQKVDRDVASAEHPSGIVKWFVEVFDTNDELVAIATILTMVQKKQEAFVEMTDEKIEESLSKLANDTQPKWGILTPQHLLEHLELGYKIMSGKIQDFEIATPEKILDQVHHSLYNYDKFPKGSAFPTYKKEELEDLVYPDFETAKVKFLEARKTYQTFFEENPDAVLKNMVFGELNKYESYLLERKHLNHHFEQFGIL